MEVVFAMGIILLVISGVVSLLLASFGARSKGYDRLKAVELSELVMEGMVNEKTTDASSFWNLQSPFWTANVGWTLTNSSYPNYNYSVSANPRNAVGCVNNPPVISCLDVTVNVGWSGSQTNESFNRFFSNQ